MRTLARSLSVALVATVGVLVVALSWSMSTAVLLTATTALFMGGTSMPNPGAGYRQAMTNNFIDPFFGTHIPAGSQFTVTTPEEFAPFQGSLSFDDSVAQGVLDLAAAIEQHKDDALYIVGYSQSTRIQAITKRNIIAAAQAAGGEFDDYPDITFVMAADLNKPNGGLLSRLSPFGTAPFFEMTADGAAPTNSPENPSHPGDFALKSLDFSFVYDGFADFPVYPANLLAVANAIAGIEILHSTYPAQSGIGPGSPDVFFQGSYGDTDYYMISTELIPLLKPLESIGVPRPLLLFLDEPARVLIETGYERGISPGQPTTIGLIPFKNPITLALNLGQSVLVGIDDAAEDLGLGRPFSTQKSGPFGVGGPTGPIPDPTAVTAPAAQTLSPSAAEPSLSEWDTVSAARTTDRPADTSRIDPESNGVLSTELSTTGGPGGDAERVTDLTERLSDTGRVTDDQATPTANPRDPADRGLSDIDAPDVTASPPREQRVDQPAKTAADSATERAVTAADTATPRNTGEASSANAETAAAA